MKLDSFVLLGVVIIIYGVLDGMMEQLGINFAYDNLLSGLLVGSLTGLTMFITGKWFKHWSEIKLKWYVALPILVGLIIIISYIF